MAALAIGCVGGEPSPPILIVDPVAPDGGGGPDPDPPDGGVNPDPSGGLSPTIVREGASGDLLLRGVILAPDRVLYPGEVLVSGRDIVCVAEDCTAEPEAADATWIETGGVISPGLIDAHNHLPYNFLPEWVAPDGQLYQNRYEWADEPSYEAHVRPYTAHRSSGSHYCPAARWGELRSLLHATTTIQGQSFRQNCVDGGARNADHLHDLGHDHMRTTIASVRDINDDDAQSYVDSFHDPFEPTTRLAVHMAEGYTGNHVEEEFDSFAGRDPRDNRHAGVSLLDDGAALLIHALSLTEAQLMEAQRTGSKIVWSPSSNLTLYGQTAPIARILELGIPTGIGPDWTISGEDDMLAELAFALEYGRQEQIAQLTPQKLWRMATAEGAEVVGLGQWLGELRPGMRADIAVFGVDPGADPYEAVITARPEQVDLVLVGGEAYAGAREIKAWVERNDECETIAVCGQERFICVRDTVAVDRGDDLAGLRQRLVDILEGNGYPPEEQYRRGGELLELYRCD